MVEVLVLLWSAIFGLFRSRARLEAEVLVLRHQINVLRRNAPKKFVFGTFDRLAFVGLYRLALGIRFPVALAITVALSRPLRVLLAIGSPGRSTHLHLHQPLSG